MTRLAPQHHASTPWRITEVAPDFELLDAWSLPATGTADEFCDLVALWNELDPASDDVSWTSRQLFWLRRRLGDWLGWDAKTNVLPIPGESPTGGVQTASVRDRLPDDLPALAVSRDSASPFRPVFATDREWTAELSNATMHAVLQLGWVAEPDGTYRGRLGVYVKP